MKTLKKFALDFAVPVVALALPLVAAAQITNPASGGLPATSGINSLATVGSSLCAIANWLFYFLIIVAVIFVVYAAFKYLTAAGDPEKVKTASHILLYAAIAIVVGIFAKALPTLVSSIIGSSSVASGC